LLGGTRNLHQLQRVLQLIERTLLKIRRDGGIDDTYLIADSQQRDGDGENAERSGGLLAGERRKKGLLIAPPVLSLLAGHTVELRRRREFLGVQFSISI